MRSGERLGKVEGEANSRGLDVGRDQAVPLYRRPRELVGVAAGGAESKPLAPRGDGSASESSPRGESRAYLARVSPMAGVNNGRRPQEQVEPR